MSIQSENLSPKAVEVLLSISNRQVRDKVESTALLCKQILAQLVRIHLPQDQVQDAGRMDISNESHLADLFLDLAQTFTALFISLEQQFPAPEDGGDDWDEDAWDLEFDLVDTDAGEAKADTHTSTTAKDPEQEVSDTAWALGNMLRQKMNSFADRLEYALAADDPWILLGELDDYKHKLQKGVQALYFGLFDSFAQVPREQLLPEYQSAVSSSIDLRRDIAELTFHVDRFNEAIAKRSGAECIPYIVALADRLSRFAQKAAYRNLRAADKREFITFRQNLHRLRRDKNGIKTKRLQLAVEGFSKFLESLHAINNREVLVLHDRQILANAMDTAIPALINKAPDAPEQAHLDLQMLFRQLNQIYGRDPDLDTLLRSYADRGDRPPHAAYMLSMLQELHRVARDILMTLG